MKNSQQFQSYGRKTSHDPPLLWRVCSRLVARSVVSRLSGEMLREARLLGDLTLGEAYPGDPDRGTKPWPWPFIDRVMRQQRLLWKPVILLHMTKNKRYLIGVIAEQVES